MNHLAPAGELPAHVLPASTEEAVVFVRPVLTAGTQPRAVVVLVDVVAQGVVSE